RGSALRLAGCLATSVSAVQAQVSLPAAPYKNPQLPVAERVRDLVGRMTLDEKFWQLYMSPGNLDNPAQDYSNGSFGLQVTAARGPDAARVHAEHINAIQKYFVERTRLGIPIMPFEEALHGLKSEGATVFPQAIGLAASFDTALMGRVATAIARETRSRGIRDVLSPVINMATDERWGRVEETYGEDPFLTSQMVLAFVQPFERMGVVTTPKHLVANVGDGGRDSYPIYANERLLRELHFPPFDVAIHAGGARSVMSAYNSVDGAPATQNAWLLNGWLKHDEGFTGFVISDAAATGGATVLHMTEASTATATQDAFAAGLDVVFQSTYEQSRPYLDAFRRGLVADSVINAAVSRVLRAKFEIGLFENPYVNPDSAAFWNGNAAHRALAREAARKSVVLLKNDNAALPLSPTARVAVIGMDATEARLGGYAGPGIKPVPILDGIRERVGAQRVTYAPGLPRVVRDYAVVPREQLHFRADTGLVNGLKGEYWDNNRLDGAPRMTRTDQRVDFGWTLNSPGRGIPFDWYSVRWTGRVTVPPGGVRHIGIEGNDGYRLWIDGKLVVDNWIKRSYSVEMAAFTGAPGSAHDLKLEYFESTGNARIKLVWDAGIVDDAARLIDSAVTIAKKSDVAVVVAGLEEGEFRDRAFLRLPGEQETLIERVADAGTPVIVIVVGGSAFSSGPWIPRARGILAVWYPGEEGGHGVADILFGDANPAGRLPVTYPISEGQLPLVYNHRPTGRGDDYLDLTGQPLYPFGFGLSYTTFEYSDLAIEPAEMAPGASATVRCTIKNTGTRAGDEVVQLYIRDVLASLARPVEELKGFARVSLAPGESKSVTFTLSPRELQMLDKNMKWVVEPGSFRIMVGASSRDIRLRGQLIVKQG
ncbi:MAG TPA: glycoside hydrolase family 3 C-terminal domain-containing protein, partial [Gemmatimonadaceae bacterium]|nr:glycoside hydrolase family 3 C-terminal domain-containing protein [Gemmatimonadaceae bacterium]